jgi:hypothetical protein
MSKQGYFDPNTISSTPLAVLGQLHIDEQGRQWIYGQDSGSGTTAGYFNDMTTDGNYDFTSTTTARVGTPGSNWKLLGVPNVNVTASYYAWYWVGYGTFECVLANGYSAADVVYTTATGGTAGSNSSSHILDGFKNIDAGVTSTRVTCWAAGRLTAGLTGCAD